MNEKKGDSTTLYGTVLSEKNESYWSLENANVGLLIKDDFNHSNVNYFALKYNETTFPVKFHLTNVHQIKHTGNYLLTLLIFDSTHRLIFEGVLFQHPLFVNQINNITFIVKDVSNLPKCVSNGYPCKQYHDLSNKFISTCCAGSKCQLSIHQYWTCGGLDPLIENAAVIYNLPHGIIPAIGFVDQYFLNITEKIYQSLLIPGTIVKVSNAIILHDSNNIKDNNPWHSLMKYTLKINLSIITSQSCEQCAMKAFASIKTKPMKFNIPLEDSSSIIVDVQSSDTYFIDISNSPSTTKDPSATESSEATKYFPEMTTAITTQDLSSISFSEVTSAVIHPTTTIVTEESSSSLLSSEITSTPASTAVTNPSISSYFSLQSTLISSPVSETEQSTTSFLSPALTSTPPSTMVTDSSISSLPTSEITSIAASTATTDLSSSTPSPAPTTILTSIRVTHQSSSYTLSSGLNTTAHR